MWSTVLLMAIVAGLQPVRIGVVAFMLSRPRPMRLLVAYFVGGFVVSVTLGALVVFVSRDAGLGAGFSNAGAIEIVVGLIALLVGALVVSGMPARLLRVQTGYPIGDGGTATVRSRVAGPPTLDSLPAVMGLRERVKAAIKGEAAWVACVLGLCMGLPATPFYLAAMAAILLSGAAVSMQVAALLIFNTVGFGAALVPIASLLVAPEVTQARVEHVYVWMKAHRRLVVAVIAGVAGIYFIVTGLRHL